MLWSRRQMLQHQGLGFGYLALTSLLCDKTQANTPVNPLQARTPHFPPRAKRVLFLFMKGGPSHIDTFDQKPLLDRDHGKELPYAKPRVQFGKTSTLMKSPWKFRRYGESGLPVSELFQHTAKHADDLCVLNSVHGTNPAHGGALLKLHTGSDRFVRPSMGAWVTYGLGTENENLPAFVTICPTLAHGGVKNWSSAFLPAMYQGTPLGNASLPAKQATLKYLQAQNMNPNQQSLQLDLLRRMNADHLEAASLSDDSLEARIASFELAFRMQSEMPELLDLNRETAATHRQYGLDNPMTEDFGRQCLLARRFLESGVRFVQVTHSDSKVQWDQHADLINGHSKNAEEVDQPIGALLADLKARGLLRDTLVIWGGEFGRTPTMQGKNGRDHNPEGFTIWLAGAGVKSGMRYGATDDYGYYAVENKMHIHDFHATLLHLMGLDHKRLTYRYAGRDFRLTDVAGEVATGILG